MFPTKEWGSWNSGVWHSIKLTNNAVVNEAEEAEFGLGVNVAFNTRILWEC